MVIKSKVSKLVTNSVVLYFPPPPLVIVSISTDTNFKCGRGWFKTCHNPIGLEVYLILLISLEVLVKLELLEALQMMVTLVSLV